MFCSQCGTEINDDSTECDSCGETTPLGQSQIAPGRKTGAAILRSLGMLILAGSITIWLAWFLLFGSTFPIILLIFACVVGGGMHYTGRKMDPHAHSATVAGAVGGVVGGAAVVIGIMVAIAIMFLVGIATFFGKIFG